MCSLQDAVWAPWLGPVGDTRRVGQVPALTGLTVQWEAGSTSWGVWVPPDVTAGFQGGLPLSHCKGKKEKPTLPTTLRDGILPC